MITYLATSNIAGWFNVDTRTVAKWRSRYSDFPAPDAIIGDVAGWLPNREAEIRAWEAARPGQGAGGGLIGKHLERLQEPGMALRAAAEQAAQRARSTR